jgi:hypothetical protein
MAPKELVLGDSPSSHDDRDIGVSRLNESFTPCDNPNDETMLHMPEPVSKFSDDSSNDDGAVEHGHLHTIILPLSRLSHHAKKRSLEQKSESSSPTPQTQTRTVAQQSRTSQVRRVRSYSALQERVWRQEQLDSPAQEQTPATERRGTLLSWETLIVVTIYISHLCARKFDFFHFLL